MRGDEFSGWEDVRAEALRRIRSHEWGAGALIPSEEQLARELSCARTTVNRALRSLAEEGLLLRRRRAGTIVAELPQRAAKLNISLIAEEIRARGATPSHLCLTHEARPLPSAIATALALPTDAPLVYVETLHRADERPFAFETRWINPASVPAVHDADFAQMSANEWLLRHAPFSHGTLDYSARPAGPEAGPQLGCDALTPTLTLDRITHGPDTAITWVRMVYAPDYHLTIKL